MVQWLVQQTHDGGWLLKECSILSGGAETGQERSSVELIITKSQID